MKEFLKQPKAIFIGIATLLSLGSLALVFTDSIGFEVFLASLVPISSSVFGLYQFFVKQAVITEANQIVKTANIIESENKQLRELFKSFQEKNDKFEKEQKSKETEVVDVEIVKAPKNKKRNYTKRKKTE